MVAGFERALKERDERPDGTGKFSDRPEQRDSDCIDPATGLPMFLALPKDVAWPPELPVYGSTGGVAVVKGNEKELPSLGEGVDGMELVWPKYVSTSKSLPPRTRQY